MKKEKNTPHSEAELLAEIEHLKKKVSILESREIELLEKNINFLATNGIFSEFMKYLTAFAFIKDNSRRIVYVNELFESNFKLTTEQWKGKLTEEIWPKEIGEAIRIDDEALLKSLKPVSREETFTFDGVTRIFFTIKFPIPIGNDINYIGGFSFDITDIKKTEKELLVSNEKYRILLDESTDPIFSFEKDGTYKYVNNAFATPFNKKPEDIIGKRIWDVFPKEEADKRFAAVKYVFETGETKVLDVKVPTPKQDRYFITSVKPVKNKEQETISVICISKEITDRKSNEIALIESENRYRRIIENMQDVYYRTDINGIITMVSPSASKEFGDTPLDEIIGRKVEDFWMYPERRKDLIEEITNKGSAKDFEAILKDKQGSPFFASITSTFVRNNNGDVVGVEGIIRNVAERTRILAELEEKNAILNKYSKELEEANASKDRFISIISHDLRSPYMGILGISDLIANENLSLEEINTLSAKLNKELKNQYQLLTELLTWSRLTRRNLPFELSNLNLISEVNEVASQLKTAMQKKEIRFLCNIPNNVFIRADKNMMRILLRNLISNAIKFSRMHGIIIMNIEEKDGLLRISVEDNGVGIDSSKIDDLFKIDKHFTTKGTLGEVGTGLGLLLCKEIIDIHKGEISVESQKEKGTKFTFSIAKGVN